MLRLESSAIPKCIWEGVDDDIYITFVEKKSRIRLSICRYSRIKLSLFAPIEYGTDDGLIWALTPLDAADKKQQECPEPSVRA